MATFQLHDREQPYGFNSTLFNAVELSILRRASELLARSLKRQVLMKPGEVRDYLRCKLSGLEFEVFGVVWLDSQNQLVADEVLFRGSICSTGVHPREIVKHALAHNARSAILYHNHPSLCANPSRLDEVLTDQIKRALELIEVRVLDHFIVAGQGQLASFAELGLI